MSNVSILGPNETPAPPATVTPLDMLNAAVSRGADVAVMERLMALHERWEASQARKAFDAAIAQAKGEIPAIVRNRTVDFTSPKGRTNYRHEDFAEVARVVNPILDRHGLTYRFRSSQEGTRLRVTCILSHRDGHSEETSLEATEDHSGNKNSIQAIGSSATYLQRYTLKLALGLATTNDDDGRAASDIGFVTDEQADAIRQLLTETGANVDRFLAYMRAESVSDIKASDYTRAVTALNRRKDANNV